MTFPAASPPPESYHPYRTYEELSPGALDRAAGIPTFTAVEETPLASREPGATLNGYVPPAAFPASVAMLERTRDALRRIPGDGEQIFASAAAAHYGTAAQAPVPAGPVPPTPATAVWPEGVIRGLLIAGVWSAARWYENLDFEGCDDCLLEEGLCSFHAPRAIKALQYEDLHDGIVNAPSDAAALHGTAIAIRVRDAVLGDIASPGSPLETLLLGALERLDAQGGVLWR